MSTLLDKLAQLPPEVLDAAKQSLPFLENRLKGKERADKIKAQFQSSAKRNAESPSKMKPEE